MKIFILPRDIRKDLTRILAKDYSRKGVMSTKRTIITNARIVDGTGRPEYPGEVWVLDGRIEYVGPSREQQPSGAEILSVAGSVVAPGFIDVHSHADNAAFLAEADTTKILQGVTTEVVGNCGMSMAPRTSQYTAMLNAYIGRLFPEVSWAGLSFQDYWAEAEAKGLVTNAAPLVGHGTLRIAAMGMSASAPSSDQLKTMQALLESALDAGAFGLSSGLIYPPGLFSHTDELVALAEVLGGAHYVTHMRGESETLEESVAEAMTIGRSAGVPVQISHHKAAGEKNWGKTLKTLPMIDRARADGLDVRLDVYPYTASSTMLTTCLPPWTQAGGDSETLARLRDPVERQRIRAALESDDPGWENHLASAGAESIRIGSTPDHRYEGRTLAAIAADRHADVIDTLLDILTEEQLKVSMVLFTMNEADVERVLAYPWTMVGSDGLPPGIGGLPHPRLYGTFPRILSRYVRERGLLSLEQAVYKMTGLPAETFGLTGRGILKAGHVADLVVFDPKTVHDVATYDDPVRAPEGIQMVMQAGQTVVHHNTYLGPRLGQRLRRER